MGFALHCTNWSPGAAWLSALAGLLYLLEWKKRENNTKQSFLNVCQESKPSNKNHHMNSDSDNNSQKQLSYKR